MEAPLELAQVGVGDLGPRGKLAKGELRELALGMEELAERLGLLLPGIGQLSACAFPLDFTGSPVLPSTGEAASTMLSTNSLLQLQELVGELEARLDELLGLGQLVGERKGGHLGNRLLDGVGPGLHRFDDRLLALADRLESLLLRGLRVVAHGRRHLGSFGWLPVTVAYYITQMPSKAT